MSDAEIERRILNNIQAQTGRVFERIGDIAVAQSFGEDLDDVVSVLAKYVDRLGSDYRGSIYMMAGRCKSPHRHLDEVIRWWQSETNPLDRQHLARVLAHVLRESDVEKIWQLSKDEAPGTTRSPIWARLAKSPKVRREVLDSIVNALRRDQFDFWELHDYVRLEDPRIAKWLQRYANSEHPVLREFARKAAGKIPPPPEWLRPSDVPPKVAPKV